jgi:outer membrane protein
METITRIRRQRNNLRIAEEQLAQKRDELTKLQLQALNDCEGYRKQTIQMRKKVEADSIAARLTTRKYEEGLSSAIDVQTSNATLLESRAQLLQCQLMLALKQKLVNYYKGIALWTER